jgi:hypothetical protein
VVPCNLINKTVVVSRLLLGMQVFCTLFVSNFWLHSAYDCVLRVTIVNLSYQSARHSFLNHAHLLCAANYIAGRLTRRSNTLLVHPSSLYIETLVDRDRELSAPPLACCNSLKHETSGKYGRDNTPDKPDGRGTPFKTIARSCRLPSPHYTVLL